MRTSTSRGFTLIEILIVVVIVSILAAIAFPSYQAQIRKSRRADAQGALMMLAQYMQREYTEYNSFTPGGDSPTLPFSEAPVDGGTKFYDLALQSASSSAYVLRATPKGAQAGDGYLELTNTGQRRWDADNSGTIGDDERSW